MCTISFWTEHLPVESIEMRYGFILCNFIASHQYLVYVFTKKNTKKRYNIFKNTT